MVVTLLPATLETGVMQDRIACPFRWTVQAPHSAIPQPNFVPVIPSVSRKTQSSGIAGLTLTVCALPFTLNLNSAMQTLLECGPVSLVSSLKDITLTRMSACLPSISKTEL